MVKVGDVVTLKTGGPTMVIGSIWFGSAECYRWRKDLIHSYCIDITPTEREYLSNESFPVNTLKVVVDGE